MSLMSSLMLYARYPRFQRLGVAFPVSGLGGDSRTNSMQQHQPNHPGTAVKLPGPLPAQWSPKPQQHSTRGAAAGPQQIQSR